MHKTQKLNTTAEILLSVLIVGLGVLGFSFLAHASTSAQITTVLYTNGVQATATNTNTYRFAVNSNWNDASTGADSSLFVLGPDNAVAYEATSTALASGSSYTESEYTADSGSNASASCNGTAPYALAGYTTGDTLSAAAAATPTLTAPNFTNLTGNKFVIIWNTDCANATTTPPGGGNNSPVNVITMKYIDGVSATAANANNASFTINSSANDADGDADDAGATTTTAHITLAANNTTAYQATSADVSGMNFTESEDTTGATTATTCDGTHPFALVGYTSGDSPSEAASATPSLTAPSFTSMSGDKFVIVWNKTCSVNNGNGNGNGTTGTISGDVASSTAGVLHVDSIDAIKTIATADGQFGDGWAYIFNLTIPTNETHVALKFADWMNTSASTTIAAGNNIRISSLQADNSDATVLVTGANTYTSPALNMTSDLDPSTPGMQVRVKVEVAVPSNTVNGTYTTTYGVKTN